MPMQRDRYPENWDAISMRIRERAGWKCEECGVENGADILRSTVDGSRYIVLDEQTRFYRWPDGTLIKPEDVPGEYPTWRKHTRIVLTTAHLDHDTTNNVDSNLRSMCQRCHNRYDMPMRQLHAAKTRRIKKQKAVQALGQLDFSDVLNAHEG